MKNLIIPIIAVACLSLASCKKERTCTCDVTSTTNGNGYAYSTSTMVSHASKKESKRLTDCYSGKTTETETVAPGVVETTVTESKCEIK